MRPADPRDVERLMTGARPERRVASTLKLRKRMKLAPPVTLNISEPPVEAEWKTAPEP